jgi:hypothetical protein
VCACAGTLQVSIGSFEWLLQVARCRVSGGDTKSLPHPDEDWAAFISTLKARCQAEGQIWDPLTKTMREWVDLKKLQNMYGSAAGTGSSTCTVS